MRRRSIADVFVEDAVLAVVVVEAVVTALGDERLALVVDFPAKLPRRWRSAIATLLPRRLRVVVVINVVVVDGGGALFDSELWWCC